MTIVASTHIKREYSNKRIEESIDPFTIAAVNTGKKQECFHDEKLGNAIQIRIVQVQKYYQPGGVVLEFVNVIEKEFPYYYSDDDSITEAFLT